MSTRKLNHRFNLRGVISFLNSYLDSVTIHDAEDDAFSPSSTGIRQIRKSQFYLIIRLYTLRRYKVWCNRICAIKLERIHILKETRLVSSFLSR